MKALQVSHITVDDDSAGQRLDNFLFRHLKGVPKTHLYRIIRSGEVRVNKGRAGADTKLQAGDVLRVPPIRVADKPVGTNAVSVPTRTFPVLYEDDCFLPIHKPAGVAVHGGSGVSSGVIEQLRKARPEAACLELVHRLDRETSGVLVVAKKRSALRALQDQFRERETGKTYLALVKGTWPLPLRGACRNDREPGQAGPRLLNKFGKEDVRTRIGHGLFRRAYSARMVAVSFDTKEEIDLFLF